MDEMEKLHKKMDYVVNGIKSCYKLCRCMVDQISNISTEQNRKIEQLEQQIKELRSDIAKLDKLKIQDGHNYSDEEIYRLKASMSWTKLSKRTNIPVTTVQYHYRRYLRDAAESEVEI